MSSLIARARGGRPTLKGAQRLIVFAAVAGAAGATLWLWPLHGIGRPPVALAAPWWALALAVYPASLVSVQVRVSRLDAALSPVEIPVAVGLYAVAPPVLLGAYAAGVMAARWSRRGLRPLHDACTLVLSVLYIAVVAAVFHAIAGTVRDALSARSLIAAAAAMACGCLLSPLAQHAAFALQRASASALDGLRAGAVQAGVSLAATGIGIAAVALLSTRPLLALSLLPPLVLVVLAQRTAAESRRRAERMEFLYHVNELLHATGDVQECAGELMAAIVSMFSADRAELLVMPETRGPAVRLRASADENLEMEPGELTFAEQETINLLRSQRVVTVAESEKESPASLLLAERHAEFGTVVLLRGHTRPQGLLILLDPVSKGLPPPAQEAGLLLTVAGHISVALENGQLAEAIKAMTAENDALARRAYYDPVTQIPNRALFLEKLTKTLARLPAMRRPLAVCFIDLDGFKTVNDTFGHAAGDEVLAALAERLRREIRRLDTVARLGGDEFGVLLTAMRREGDAPVVARRIVEILSRPVQLREHTVSVGASVGVALVDDLSLTLAPEELLRRADMAMYLAKRQGKRRFVVFNTAARDTVIATPGQPPREAVGV